MKKHNLFIMLLVIFGLSTGCYLYAQKATTPHTEVLVQQQTTPLKNDTFPLTGSYRWTFFLGPVEQLSTHTFAPNHIDYQMQGKIHSTKYRMQQLSYDHSQNKWIGQTPDGTVYTLFFKNIESDKLTIYKRKCTKGLSEATALPRPSDDTTADHGWNVYTREDVVETNDTLGFDGTFYGHDGQTLTFHDDKAIWDNKTYQKLSHHLGERRWVGKNGNQYLLIFYDYVKGTPQGKFAVIAIDDVTHAYQLKHNQQKFITYEVQ